MEKFICLKIKHAQELIKNSHEDDGLQILEKLCNQYSANVYIRLKYALSLDGLSKEELAIPNYQKAIQLGLSKDQEKVALICLASSFRNINKLEEALNIINEALKKHPNNVVAECFYSLILLDYHCPSQALKVLGLAMLKNSELALFEGFKDALYEKYMDLSD
ncbi:tetratricopeptide repeat protein [Terrilactibacillus laevilacticus]|uniref:Tetratricopeptide repeat protein n=1 Tax=Terrilactibacillus laevilacticus TaxID=1380157 RepID=A0ABW5PNH4_9BACI|nr:tetratricopeptide repeat protein [Terrilactibacillus laevilacticus]